MTGKQLYVETFGYLQGLAEAIGTQKESKHLGGICQQLCTYCRSFAILLLVKEKDANGFFYWLTQSALVRNYYLEKCQAEGNLSAVHRRFSLSNAFLDAIAAGRWQLAAKIGALSYPQWMQGEEYEDDFAFAHFLYLLISSEETTAKQAALLQLLQQYEQALEGNEDVRLELCKALLNKDQKAFDTLFSGLLELYATPTYNGYDPDPYQKINNQVMVEGLAVLQIAERLGLKTKTVYKLCPAAARKPIDGSSITPAFPFINEAG